MAISDLSILAPACFALLAALVAILAAGYVAIEASRVHRVAARLSARLLLDTEPTLPVRVLMRKIQVLQTGRGP